MYLSLETKKILKLNQMDLNFVTIKMVSLLKFEDIYHSSNNSNKWFKRIYSQNCYLKVMLKR